MIRDVESAGSTLVDGTEFCSFEVWNRDGSFTVNCVADQDRTGAYYIVDAVTGAMTLALADADLESTEALESAALLTQRNAIDALRSWSGGATSGTSLRPPTVTGPDRTEIDLWEDFTNVPDSYAVIFGVRG